MFYTLFIMPWWQVQHMTTGIDLTGKLQRLADTTALPIPYKGFDGFLMVTLQLSLVELQSFLLSLLSGIAHITFARLLDAEDI